MMFSFQTTSLQKEYEDAVNQKQALKTKLWNYRKEEYTRQYKNQCQHIPNSDLYMQLKSRNIDLIESIKEERISTEYVNVSDFAQPLMERTQVCHKLYLLKYTEQLEMIKCEKHMLK